GAARGGHRMREETAAGGGALPPGDPLRRLAQRVRGRASRQAGPAHPGGSVSTGPWADRVDGADWDHITGQVNEHGCALTPQLMTPAEREAVATLYEREEPSRSPSDGGGYRFGGGGSRYLGRPSPGRIEPLKRALYPRLLPIARDWYGKLGRPTPWPDTLDEWLDMCHAAGQVKP